MRKFKEMNAKQKRNLFIVIGVVSAVILALLIGLIVFVAPVEGEITTEHWYSRMQYTDDYAFNINKEPGKDFKILAIADPQLADLVEVGGQGDPLDEMKLLVERENPDLIIVMGDITWTGFTKLSVKKFVKCMDEIGVPWAPILGNHEDEKEQGYFCNVDRNWVADRLLESKTCLFKKGPNNIGGVGNYVINIKENGKIVKSLIMMDSHAKRKYPEYDNGWYYDYIYDAQMLWYNWVIDGVTALNGGDMPESMVYIHIPLPEYEIAYSEYELAYKNHKASSDALAAATAAYDEAKTAGNIEEMAKQAAIKAEKEIEVALYKANMDSYAYIGRNVEGVWGSNTAGDDKIKNDDKDKQKEEQLENCVNSGFFDVLKEKGSTKYVYAGHDHKNNYSLLYEGIRLTYTTKTGYKCSYVKERTGGTVINIGDSVEMRHVYAVYNEKGKLVDLKDGEVF